MKLFCHEDGFCAYRYCCGHCSCVHFPFFLSCVSWTISASPVRQHVTTATSSSRDAEPSKKNRRWSLMQVVPSSLVGIFLLSRFVLCNVNVQTMDIKMITNLNCFISNVFVSMYISWIRSSELEVQGLLQD